MLYFSTFWDHTSYPLSFLFYFICNIFIFTRLFICLNYMCIRAITATHRDYWWGHSSNPRRSNSSSNNDRCPRQGHRPQRGNLLFLPKRFLHRRPLRPANFRRAPIAVLQILHRSIGCNGLRLLPRQQLNCLVKTHILYLHIIKNQILTHIMKVTGINSNNQDEWYIKKRKTSFCDHPFGFYRTQGSGLCLLMVYIVMIYTKRCAKG